MSLVSNILSTFQRIGADIKALRLSIGTLLNLNTADKTDLVSAINEVNTTTDNIYRVYNATSSTVSDLATEISNLDPPLVIGQNDIYLFKLTNGDSYVLKDKGKGTYGVGGVTDLVVEDFIQINSDIEKPPTGLEAIDEGNGVGFRLIGKDPENYGNIGLNAVDLSESFLPSQSMGATGPMSHAEGSITTASGYASHAEGNETTASGVGSHAEGSFNFARAEGEHSGGRYGTDYTPANDGTDRIMNYGIGDADFNRLDGLTLFRNGAVRFFRAALSSITNAAAGFFIFDSGKQNRPAVHNGTGWEHLAYESDIAVQSKENNGTVFDLSVSAYYTAVSGVRTANAATSYTFTGATLGKYGVRLINAATEPILTGATKIKGSDFVASTDMYMKAVVTPTRTEYWFEEI